MRIHSEPGTRWLVAFLTILVPDLVVREIRSLLALVD
jgi:hypothetical protein